MNAPVTTQLFGSQTNRISDTEMTRLLMNVMTTDMQPFSFFEGTGFRAITSLISPGFVMPSSEDFEEKLDCSFDQAVALLKMQLSKADYVAIANDGLTTAAARYAHKPFDTISVHFLYEEEYHSKCLHLHHFKPNKHSGQHIRDEILSCLKDWKIKDKTVCITTSNAEDHQSASQLIHEAHPNINSTPCAAHTLQLAIRDAIDSAPAIQSLLNQCKVIGKHFKHSEDIHILERVQKRLGRPDLKYLDQVKTYWNSSFYWLDRILEIEPALHLAQKKMSTQLPVLHKNEHVLIREVKATLDKIGEATKELCGEKYAPISLIIPVVSALKDHLANVALTLPASKNFRDCLIKNIDQRFDNRNFFENKICLVATVLDPRFKLLVLDQKRATTAREFLLSELEPFYNNTFQNPAENLPKDEAKPTFLSSFIDSLASNVAESTTTFRQFDSPAEELNSFLAKPLVPGTSTDVFAQWSKLKSSFPNLHKLACQYLIIPAASVSSERLFSQSGKDACEKRFEISKYTMNKLIFVKTNN